MSDGYAGYMLMLSTVVPVAGSVGVAIHWLVKAWIVNKKTKTYHQTVRRIKEEARAKFSEDDPKSFDWVNQETNKRLAEKGFRKKTGMLVGDFSAASRVGAFLMPVAQQVDQWILIVSAIIGVILMGFGL
jgi:hypothetical protein